MAMKCGLLGERLGHSRSPEIHRSLGDYEYRLYEKRPDEVETFLRHGDYDVVNVTIPYKKTAYALCDEVSPIAKALGNVNVIVRRLDGTLWGDNTDAYGFGLLLDEVSAPVVGGKCVVLGTGGAASTAATVLRARGAAAVVFISRSGGDNYSNLDRHADAAVVVNATPVGMFPAVDAQPVSLSAFPRCRAVVDLIYNPETTRLLADAARRGIPAVGGMKMLVGQAERASVYMNANFYLYGPPGSGKSTFGRRLAAQKGLPFVDLDDEIVRADGRPIPRIFAEAGEGEFRRIERETLRRVAAGRNQVVALGGGALLDDSSRELAETTGRVVLLTCDEAELARRVASSDGRPLLAGDSAARLHRLLQSRRAHYESFGERVSPEA